MADKTSIPVCWRVLCLTRSANPGNIGMFGGVVELWAVGCVKLKSIGVGAAPKVSKSCQTWKHSLNCQTCKHSFLQRAYGRKDV